MHHRTTLSMPFLPALLLGVAATGLAAQPAHAETPARRIAATEVTVKAKHADKDWLRDHLGIASEQESHYYDIALPPATMRIVIDKVSTKSAGKALASNLPLVGMFSGSNENRLRGKIELVDTATGRVLKKAKIDCDDYTQYSAADGLIAYAEIGASFLPFGGLLSIASDIGRSAANDRVKAQEKLIRGFVMLSYKKIYGAKTYKSFAARRKTDLAAVKSAATPIAAGDSINALATPTPVSAPVAVPASASAPVTPPEALPTPAA